MAKKKISVIQVYGSGILTRSLEARIAEHPEQWFWIHRRWKYNDLPSISAPVS
ncbi:MAG TPA: hypothetical protein PKV95_02235 [Anaerolineaceae bacterium]|nr:hypothetical protein [Anaerolineaceae bacterium]